VGRGCRGKKAGEKVDKGLMIGGYGVEKGWMKNG